MKFDERYNHGPRLVFRRIYQFFIGPRPSLYVLKDMALWQFGVMPFIRWQRPVTDSAYHFDRCGIELHVGPYTLTAAWVDH